MPSKLKDLKVTKVDFVDAGANQKANILLYKNKEGTPADTEKAESSTTPETKPDNILKRVLRTVAKVLGIEDEKTIDTAMENLQKSKDAESFDDKMEEATMRVITSQIWDVCYALEESLCSVILDDEIPWGNKAGYMEQSLTQFNMAVSGMIAIWASGKTAENEKIAKADRPMTPERITIAKAARDALNTLLATTTEPTKQHKSAELTSGGNQPTKNLKGEDKDMKIDKSKLTPEEIAALEAIEKKAGIQEDPTPTPTPAPAIDPVAKEATAAPVADESEDIYKGLHPAIKAELESLRKTAERLEDRELTEIAKKYEILGKKPEDLVKTFKSLKAAGGDAYEQMLALLDATKEAYEKSGVFKEIGKKGIGMSDAWEAIEKHADEIQKAAPTLSRVQAIEKACEQHPELVSEYEENR